MKLSFSYSDYGNDGSHVPWHWQRPGINASSDVVGS